MSSGSGPSQRSARSHGLKEGRVKKRWVLVLGFVLSVAVCTFTQSVNII